MMRLVAVAMVLGACSPPIEATVAITNVDVLTMADEAILEDQTVLVLDGRIAWIGSSTKARFSANARTIDGEGSVLVPGLADMHTHVELADLPLFLANGVTTIREMNGSEEHLVWRDDIRSGRRTGPTMHVSGTLIAGQEIPWRHVVASSPEEAVRLVRQQVAAGFEFIKAYDGLSRETYDALVAEASRNDIPVVGHIPRDVGLAHVVEARQQSIEHVEQIMYSVVGHEPDESRIPEAVATIKRGGTWVTPTLAVIEGLFTRSSPWFASLYERDEMKYVSAGTRGWWESLRPGPFDVAAVWKPVSPGVSFLSTLVQSLHASGVRMLAGSDTPNPMMVPGFSLHDELDALGRAGLSPYEVLKTATVHPAEFLDLDGEFGTIVVGARADLVLVQDNPLFDLSVLRRPAAVMVRGQWLDRGELDAMLAEATSGN